MNTMAAFRVVATDGVKFLSVCMSLDANELATKNLLVKHMATHVNVFPHLEHNHRPTSYVCKEQFQISSICAVSLDANELATENLLVKHYGHPLEKSKTKKFPPKVHVGPTSLDHPSHCNHHMGEG
jgi:hypothetical protein